jgi:hypothetical protein
MLLLLFNFLLQQLLPDGSCSCLPELLLAAAAAAA